MYVGRHLESQVERFFTEFPCVALLGARQVGKSTLLREKFGALEYRLLDQVGDPFGARADPGLFLRDIGTPLILDEVQYAPELLSTVKREVDQRRSNGLYLLTGSAQWELVKGLSDSLAGRVILLRLDGFSFGERAGQPASSNWLPAWLESAKEGALPRNLGRHDLPLQEVIWRGDRPLAVLRGLDTVPAFLDSYLATYMQRDVRLVAEPANVDSFFRFLSLCAGLTAQEVNLTQFGREIGITPQTSARWLTLLEGTYQVFRLPAYSRNALKKVSLKTKMHIVDTGIGCRLQRISSPSALSGHPLTGALFESLVVGELRKQSNVLGTAPAMSHWRAHSGAEVDLVLERDGWLYPIECKMKSMPSKSDCRGITAFRQAHEGAKIAAGAVICACEMPYALTDQDFAIPWDATLAAK